MNPELPNQDVLDNPYQYTDYKSDSTREARGTIFGEPGSGDGRVVAGRGTGPDFVEALARGLDVLAALGDGSMTLAEVAAAADLARPTARRLLLTLEELGYVSAARRQLRAHAARPPARDGVRRGARPLGRRPPAPRGPRGADG